MNLEYLPQFAIVCGDSQFFISLKQTSVCNKHLSTKISKNIEVCVFELGTKRDDTGGDGRPFPSWRYQDETNVFWSRHSRKFGKNPGNKRDERGLLNTVREIPEEYRISRLFPEKPQ